MTHCGCIRRYFCPLCCREWYFYDMIPLTCVTWLVGCVTWLVGCVWRDSFDMCAMTHCGCVWRCFCALGCSEWRVHNAFRYISLFSGSLFTYNIFFSGSLFTHNGLFSGSLFTYTGLSGSAVSDECATSLLKCVTRLTYEIFTYKGIFSGFLLAYISVFSPPFLHTKVSFLGLFLHTLVSFLGLFSHM